MWFDHTKTAFKKLKVACNNSFMRLVYEIYDITMA